MTTIPQQIQNLKNSISSLRALINGTRDQGLWYALFGNMVVYGCMVTEGSSAADLYLSLDGEYSGDSAHLNPDIQAAPVRHEEYPNIAVIYGEVFEMANINVSTTDDDSLLLDDAPPTTDFSRYDIVYGYVGQSGPAVGIMAGTATAAVKTDFTSNGLDTTAYPSATGFDPTLAKGMMPLARVYVTNGDTGIADARIADLRDFTGRLGDRLP